MAIILLVVIFLGVMQYIIMIQKDGKPHNYEIANILILLYIFAPILIFH